MIAHVLNEDVKFPYAQDRDHRICAITLNIYRKQAYDMALLY